MRKGEEDEKNRVQMIGRGRETVEKVNKRREEKKG